MAESSSNSEDLSGGVWHSVKRVLRPRRNEDELDESNGVWVFVDLETTQLDSTCDPKKLYNSIKVELRKSEKSDGRELFPSKIIIYGIGTPEFRSIKEDLKYMGAVFKPYQTRSLKCGPCKSEEKKLRESKKTKQECTVKPDLVELDMLRDICIHAISLQQMHVSLQNIMIITNDPFFVKLGNKIEKRRRGNFRVHTIVPKGLIRVSMKMPLGQLS